MVRKKITSKSREYQEYAESIINTVREPLIVLDQDLRVVSASRSFYKVFKVNPKETEGQLIYNLGNKQWDIPRLRELLETILPQKTTFNNFEVEHEFSTIGKRTMLLNARQIRRVFGKERIILLAIEDITERKKLEGENNRLSAIVDFSDDAIISTDLKGNIKSWNHGAEVIFGHKAKEIIDKSAALLMASEHPEEFKELIAKRISGELIKNYETKRKRKDRQNNRCFADTFSGQRCFRERDRCVRQLS